MSFSDFLQRFQARQRGNTPALPPVPAYQGPIRQDLNLFEQSGQTMGAPAIPLSTDAQALAQLANFMALRQQAQGGAVPPVLGPLALLHSSRHWRVWPVQYVSDPAALPFRSGLRPPTGNRAE